MKLICKWLSLCLFAAMLLTAFASCAKPKPENPGSGTATNGTQSEQTREEVTTKVSALEQSGLEKKNFGGRKMKIWHGSGTVWSPYPMEVTLDEALTDIIYDGAYKRNTGLERDLNITLQFVDSGTDPNTVGDNTNTDKKALDMLWKSGDSASYDMILAGGFASATLATEGFFLDLDNCKDVKPDADYYESRVNRQVRLMNHQYFASGFYSVTGTNGIEVIYVNTDIINSVNTDPDNPVSTEVLYEKALNKTWTVDYMLELGSRYALPSSNTGVYESDQYGTIFSYHSMHSVYHGLGGTDIVWNDASNRYNVVLSNQSNQKIFEYIREKITQKNGGEVLLSKRSPGAGVEEFLAKSAPFFWGGLNNIKEVIADGMHWTMLPPPLFKEGNDYNSFTSAWCLNFAGIPSNVTDSETSSYLYEMFMCYSYDYLYPAYYETCFQVTYQPDSTSVRIFNLIARSRYVSMVNLYSLNNSGVEIKDICRDTNLELGSSLKRASEVIAANLTKLVENFSKKEQ